LPSDTEKDGDFEHGQPTGGKLFWCGACRRTGTCRLGLTDEWFDETDGPSFAFVCPADHEGAPGIAHGGWTAAAFDDFFGRVPMFYGTMAYTGTLTVRFEKPVPIGTPLRARARLERRVGRKWYVDGELAEATSGSILATGEGVFIEPQIASEGRSNYFSEQVVDTVYAFGNERLILPG
jgi:acyl-coenzyme A thioesterase PaaI-like protein